MRRSIRSLAAALLSAGVLVACSNGESLRFPVVLRVARTIPSDSGAEYDDYQRMGNLVENIVEQLKTVDPSIQIQTALYGRRNFADEIERQTQSGFGPDLIITDSETTLNLYSRNLIHPIEANARDINNIPQYIFNLVKAKDGKIVGQPVSQYVQLACYNKEKIPTSPESLRSMTQANDELTLGLALQLKDLYWTAEAFDAEEAIEIAISGDQPSKKQAKQLTRWLNWLKTASYQQNIRFLNDQNSLRRALIAGDLDWITCWSTNLPELRDAMKDKLGVSGLPKGPSGKLRAMTRLSVWSLGLNSSPRQRDKALTFIDFITKPWAQKTYALRNKASFPVDKNAAKIVASKIPGGYSALSQYEEEAIKVSAAASRTKAMVFRDPERYDTISQHLLDTIYDIETPEEASQNIVSALKERKQ